jgi:hypothetical protein
MHVLENDSTQAKRKRSAISLQLKNEILEASVGKSERILSKQFGLPKTTIHGILKNRETIKHAIADGHGAKRARLRKATHEDVENSVLFWMKNARSENVPISGPLLQVFDSLFSI